MKLSNARIVNEAPILSAISQKQLPVKVSYAILKNISKIQADLEIYNTEREKLIEKYSEKDETGKTIIGNGSIKLQKEHIDDWGKDIKELDAIDNEVEIHKFKMSDFEGKNCDSFSPSELMAIDYMIED